MSAVRQYFAQAFKSGKGGMFVPQPPQPAKNEAGARALAERLAKNHRGAIAVAQMIDKDVEFWGEPEVLARFGQTPEAIG